MNNPDVGSFFHQSTNIISYVVSDLSSREIAAIDPVLDCTDASGHVRDSVRFTVGNLDCAAIQ